MMTYQIWGNRTAINESTKIHLQAYNQKTDSV